jgi:hypothetical protein
MNKQITKRQHFVPQFYLNNFANTKRELHIYDSKVRRIMKDRPASGVCYEDFFYAAETGKPDDISQEIEDFFSSEVEDPLSKELPNLILKLQGNMQITDNDKYNLSILANTMWLRGTAMRNQINSMEEQLLRKMNKMSVSHPSFDKKIDEFTKEEGTTFSKKEREEMKKKILNDEYEFNFSNQSHLRFMLDNKNMEGFSNLFFGQNWIIHISKCGRQFITSDNPITVILPKRMSFYGPTFLERTHIFPITPSIAIETFYPHNISGKKLKRKTHYVGAEEEIDRINLLIAGQANYLYSSRTEEISWFDEYAKEIERLSEENMKKIVQLTLRAQGSA